MRFDENFNVSLSLNPKREMIKVMKKYLLVSLLALLAFVGKAQEDNSDIVKVGDTMLRSLGDRAWAFRCRSTEI